jgi:hypothetical protein
MALVCAVEPWALSLPVEHVGAAAALDDDDEFPPAGLDVVLFVVFELEQAAIAIVHATSPAMTPTRDTFTIHPLRDGVGASLWPPVCCRSGR